MRTNASNSTSDNEIEHSSLIPSPPTTVADLEPIHDKLDTIADSMKELIVLYTKSHKANQLLAEENKRLATELALVSDKLRRLIDSSENSYSGPISPTSSSAYDSQDSNSSCSGSAIKLQTSFDDIVNSTNNVISGSCKQLVASTVKLIGNDLYFIGDVILRLPELNSKRHEFAAYFESIPTLTKSYVKLIRNSCIDAEDLVLCLGFSDQRRITSYVDSYFLSSKSLYQLQTPYITSIVDITAYDTGFLISYYLNDGSYDVGYIDCAFIKESTIKKLGSRISSIAPDIRFTYIGEFLYSHKSNICFFFNGELKERQIASVHLSGNHRERSESIPMKNKSNHKSKHKETTDDTVIERSDQHSHKHSSKRHHRKTVSVNEDLERDNFKQQPAIKVDAKFVLKLHQILKDVLPPSEPQPRQPTNPHSMNNSLFIKKKNYEPEIVKIPEQCGRVISAHPYDSDYYVLTDKHFLLKITGLNDDDPNCKIHELSIFPKDDYNRLYIKEINEYVAIEGFDKSIFLTTPNAVYRVYSISDDVYYTTKIYSLTGNQTIINLRIRPDSLTLYLSDYSVLNIHFSSLQLQTYTHIGAHMFNA